MTCRSTDISIGDGFMREGVMKSAVFKDGEIADLLAYGKLRKDSGGIICDPSMMEQG